MTDESYKLSVALESDGADGVQDDLNNTEEQLQETTETMDDAADDAEDLSARWQGAFGAIVSGLAVAAGGILSQIPVIRGAAAGLSAVADALALRLDRRLRPAMSGFNKLLFGGGGRSLRF
jgi:hypothetical protein